MAKNASKQYILICIMLTLVASSVVGLVNYFIDPLHFYRMGNHGVYQYNQRYQNPGLARNFEYSTLLLGTSHTENTLSAYVDQALNTKSLRLAIAGSTAHEQYLTLNTALQSKRVDRVIWGLDYFSFLGPFDEVNIQSPFPYYLYQEDWSTAFKYLLSMDTLKQAVKAFMGRGLKDIDARNVWYDRFKFSYQRVLEAYTFECQHPRTILRLKLLETTDLDESVQKNLINPIKSNPEIRFDLFLPPHSIAYHVFNQENYPELLKKSFDFRQLIYELSELPNVHVYDFQLDDSIIYNLDLYKDLTHYNKSINEYIIKYISENQQRLYDNPNVLLQDKINEFQFAQSPEPCETD